MIERVPPELLLIDVEEAKERLKELIQRAKQGAEIVLTIEGKPSAMLSPPEAIQVMSNVGVIHYELPRSMGGHAWLGPFEPGELDEDNA